MTIPLPDIAVIALPDTPVVVKQYLGGIPHRVVEADAEPDPVARTFHAHQKAMREATGAATLVLEHDAFPARQNWQQVVHRGVRLLDTYEVVSLHALHLTHSRSLVRSDTGAYREPLVTHTAAFTGKWVRSTLAYLVGPAARDRLAGAKYAGMPLDLWLANELNMAVMPAGTFGKS